MTMVARITFGFAAMALLGMAIAVTGYLSNREMHDANRVIAYETVPELVILGELDAEAARLQRELISVLLLAVDAGASKFARDEVGEELDEELSDLRSAYSQFKVAVKRYKAMHVAQIAAGLDEEGDDDELASFAAIDRFNAQVGPLIDRVVAQAAEGMTLAEAHQYRELVEAAEAEFEIPVHERIEEELEEIEERVEHAELVSSSASMISFGSGTVGVLAALLLGGILARSLRGGIAELRSATARVGAGDLGGRIDSRRSDEFGECARAFDAMTAQLGESTVRREALEQELVGRREAESRALVAKQAAESASLAKSQFLANMSHEIRTPLNAVMGFSELLNDTRLDEEQERFARIILSSGRGLLSIIDDVLDFSKIEAREKVLETIAFDLSLLLEESIEIASARLKKGSEVQLYWNYDERLPRWFSSDPTVLRQILLNLVTNAIKFTAKGSVGVVVEQQAGGDERVALRITVRDTGIGIAADKIDHVFQEFAQADESTTRQYGGTGLGLAITRSLVQLLGGRITVNSQLGSGSEFIVELELTSTEEAATQAGNVAQPGTVRTALIVDDNEHSRDLLQLHCRRCGIEVLHLASSAIEALGWLQASGRLPEVILSDVLMPGMDGYAFARALRAMPSVRGSRLIAVSSDGTTGMSRAARDAGFDALLGKPVTTTEFARIVGYVAETMTADAMAADASAAPPSCGRILVAEDNAVNQKLIRMILSKLGHQFDIVANGMQAVAATQSKDYALILMDLQMPVMGGLDATKQIRLRLPDVPIIALTAAVAREDRDSSLQAGMNDFLTKPFDIGGLKAIIERWAR